MPIYEEEDAHLGAALSHYLNQDEQCINAIMGICEI